MNFPWLTTLIAVPLLGAALTALVPRGLELAAKRLALFIAVITAIIALVAAVAFVGEGQPEQFVEQYEWVGSLGVFYAVGANGVSLSLIVLTAVVTPIVLLAMWREAEAERRNPKPFFALVLLLEAMIIGTFAAQDVLLFYVLFEAMLVPMYFLIGLYGGPQRRYAAVKFLLYNLLGGLIMLAAVIGLYVQSVNAGQPSFLLADLVALEVPVDIQRWLFLGFMFAFAIKAPLWPFHTWLPDAAAESTPANAAYLSGVMDKVGTFGMIALVLPLFPDATREFAPVVVVLAVISIVYGALLAVGQTDMKRLIAYTSISHFGFIVLGIFALTSQGVAGSTLYMVNHGLSTVALFVIVGFLIVRRGSRLVADYGGVAQPAPILAGSLLFAGLSGLALPGLATFVSEFLVLVGTYSRYRAAGVVATVGIILAALYILLFYQRTMTGPAREATRDFPDLRRREILVVAPLVALLLAVGFFPKPLLDVIDDGVRPTLVEVGVSDPEPITPAAEGSE
ncbi:MAG TPA: NADH-quinone oxidoreductase subunit M [Jiangellaceae bacterium]|nr:NADH-quinone oxidoreductase subunit M [Jiangellaceae bacterium]